MTALADLDGQRARWRRSLRREALDDTGREDFAVGGLGSRLRSPSVQLLLLPADPEAHVVSADDGLWAWLRNFQSVNVDGRVVRLGSQEVPTAYAAALVDSYGSREAWTSYVAVHRSGALEFGLGENGAWERADRDENLVRVFNLISIVARTWALLAFGSAIRDRIQPAGPFQLTTAVCRTGGAFLGNVAEGWAEPLTWDNELPPCSDDHLLWHIEMNDWPTSDEIPNIAFAVGDRLEDAWGVQNRRYFASRGPLNGRFDTSKLQR